MLKNTFIHAPGIGYRTETLLWERGIIDWDDCLACAGKLPFSGRRGEAVASCVERSRQSLEKGDCGFFSSLVPAGEAWRVYPEFRSRACFVDIETTGLDLGDEVTMVGIYAGGSVRTYIAGINLHEAGEALAEYPLVITYNGSCFDLPFLRRLFPGAFSRKLHIDLRYPLKRLNYSGGLKHIERELGIERSPETRSLDGFDAVRLWREYKSGSRKALEVLVKYNSEDIEGLESLMELAYSGLREKTMGRFIRAEG